MNTEKKYSALYKMASIEFCRVIQSSMFNYLPNEVEIFAYM